MSNIYLSRIRINNFRTFGSFDIDIPAAPGLILLTGTNGLGKSSFFDAIEWGLTGKIRRFTPYVGNGKIPEGDYLTRRGADPASHKVALFFSDGNPVERSATSATPMSSIISELTRADRPAINDLSTYLALTHFLGQAAQQRFTSREPQDQWQALKGPSGIERLEQVRAGLRGRPTTSAFTRRIDDQQSAVTSIQKQIAEWQGWQARLDRLRQAARATGALTGDEIAHRTSALEAELFLLLRETVPAIEGETSSQRMARLTDRIAQALRSFAEREATIEGLLESIGQFTTASANARADHPLLVRVREEVDNARLGLSAKTSNAETADADVIAQKAAIATIEQEVTILEAVRSDLVRRDELGPQIDVAQGDVSTLTTIVAERRAALATTELAIRERADIAAKVVQLRIAAQRARTLIEAQIKLDGFEASLSRDAVALDSARQTASTARLEIEPLKRESDSLNRRIREAIGKQAEVERHASAINAAVAMIASHIHDDDVNCPVCRTPFDPGQLKLLAGEAARSRDARLAEVAAEIERLRTNALPINARIGKLQADIDAHPQLERNWEANRETVSKARAALARELGADVGDNLGAVVAAFEQSSRADLTEAESALAPLDATAIAKAEQRAAIVSELEELIAREAQAASRLSNMSSEDHACRERITARGMAGASIESLNTRLSETRASLEVARGRLVQFADAAASAKSQLDSQRSALAAAERALAEAESTRANAEATADQLVRRWTRSGLAGTPSQAVADETLGALRERASAVHSINGRLLELASDNQDALLQEEINEIVNAMRSAGGEAGLAAPKSYLAELQADEAAARAALKLTKDVRKAVTSFTELLKTRAENFSAHVLAPLNGIIDDFNNAMLSTPGESIQFKAEHRVDTTNFGMSLRYREQIEAAIERQKDLPPQVVLSEGQLAANGFSILCAASTAYPWSRWRALLLDDPLQHNDIIHTAAFVDVMRNMVELQGYQLIVSSHDRGESDFIARKFDAAGLACSRIVLTAPSDKGVVYEGPEHNQAGRRIMQKSRGNMQNTA